MEKVPNGDDGELSIFVDEPGPLGDPILIVWRGADGRWRDASTLHSRADLVVSHPETAKGIARAEAEHARLEAEVKAAPAWVAEWEAGDQSWDALLPHADELAEDHRVAERVFMSKAGAFAAGVYVARAKEAEEGSEPRQHVMLNPGEHGTFPISPVDVEAMLLEAQRDVEDALRRAFGRPLAVTLRPSDGTEYVDIIDIDLGIHLAPLVEINADDEAQL